MEPPLCEHTIRKCIEALEWFPTSCSNGEYWRAINDARNAILNLIPKKDRAKELVAAYAKETGQHEDGEELSQSYWADEIDFANYLISNNLINEKGAL